MLIADKTLFGMFLRFLRLHTNPGNSVLLFKETLYIYSGTIKIETRGKGKFVEKE